MSRLFSFSSNVFDFVITGASLAFAVLKLAYGVDFNVTMLRALRLTRALRVTRSDSSKETAKLRVLFDELDDDGSGLLEAEEMSQLALRLGMVLIGLGRIVALYCRSSALYQIH